MKFNMKFHLSSTRANDNIEIRHTGITLALKCMENKKNGKQKEWKTKRMQNKKNVNRIN